MNGFATTATSNAEPAAPTILTKTESLSSGHSPPAATSGAGLGSLRTQTLSMR